MALNNIYGLKKGVHILATSLQRAPNHLIMLMLHQCKVMTVRRCNLVTLVCLIRIWPDKEHIARCPAEGDDEGSDDGQSQEVREHPVTVVRVRALTCTGRKVTGHTDTATVREDLERHTWPCIAGRFKAQHPQTCASYLQRFLCTDSQSQKNRITKQGSVIGWVCRKNTL